MTNARPARMGWKGVSGDNGDPNNTGMTSPTPATADSNDYIERQQLNHQNTKCTW